MAYLLLLDTIFSSLCGFYSCFNLGKHIVHNIFICLLNFVSGWFWSIWALHVALNKKFVAWYLWLHPWHSRLSLLHFWSVAFQSRAASLVTATTKSASMSVKASIGHVLLVILLLWGFRNHACWLTRHLLVRANAVFSSECHLFFHRLLSLNFYFNCFFGRLLYKFAIGSIRSFKYFLFDKLSFCWVHGDARRCPIILTLICLRTPLNFLCSFQIFEAHQLIINLCRWSSGVILTQSRKRWCKIV